MLSPKTSHHAKFHRDRSSQLGDREGLVGKKISTHRHTASWLVESRLAACERRDKKQTADAASTQNYRLSLYYFTFLFYSGRCWVFVFNCSIFTSPLSGGVQCIAMSYWVCLSVCLSVPSHNSTTTWHRPNFTNFFLRVDCGRGDMLCTSGFVDNVTSSTNLQ